MELTQFFKRVVVTLKKNQVQYALAGGLAASVYRVRERTTNDLDFLILAEAETQETAISIIKKFKLVPNLIRKADLEGGPLFAIKRKSTIPYMIVGRSEKAVSIGLDFILPTMPWFDEAIKRAAHNEIDFGFGQVPCLTKEDLILSKLYSLSNDQTRFNDLDDLKSIFQAGHVLDMAYLCGQMQKLELMVPISLKDFSPKALLLTSKRVRRKFRNR